MASSPRYVIGAGLAILVTVLMAVIITALPALASYDTGLSASSQSELQSEESAANNIVYDNASLYDIETDGLFRLNDSTVSGYWESTTVSTAELDRNLYVEYTNPSDTTHTVDVVNASDDTVLESYTLETTAENETETLVVTDGITGNGTVYVDVQFSSVSSDSVRPEVHSVELLNGSKSIFDKSALVALLLLVVIAGIFKRR